MFIGICLFQKQLQTNCLLLSKQKPLDADSRTVKQIIFTGKIKAEVANATLIIYYILEQSKKTILQFSKGTTKVLWIV